MSVVHNVRPSLLETAELVPIESLEFLEGNARLHDDGELTASLVRWGQFSAVLVRRLENGRRVIISGNGTVTNQLGLGWTHTAVEWFEGTDTEAIGVALAANKTSDNASDDPGLTAALLAQLDGDLTGTGWNADEHAALLAFNDTPLVFDDEPDDDRDDDKPLLVDVPVPYGDELLIASAFDHWRTQSFPFPALAPHESMQQINRLTRTPTASLRNTATAYGVPDAYHPHRFSTKIPGKWTPLEAFDRDDKLTHAIRMLVENGVAVTPSSLRSMLGFVRNSQCAANFRPGFALLLLRKYAPVGGTWLDTSTGFGGRLVAFAASALERYVGIDPSTATDAGNRAMCADLGIDDRVTLIAKPAEDVTLDEVGGPESCDFAFTSPPYFGKERYADEPTQSFMRYRDGNAWREGFLVPTLELQHAALKSGAVAVVNIADVKIGTETYPLTDWTIDAGRRAGFVLERTDTFPLSRVPGRGEAAERFEPVFVFRKP